MYNVQYTYCRKKGYIYIYNVENHQYKRLFLLENLTKSRFSRVYFFFVKFFFFYFSKYFRKTNKNQW